MKNLKKWMGKTGVLAAVLAMLCGGASTVSAAVKEKEPNDLRSQATYVEPKGTVTGTISKARKSDSVPGDVDYYKTKAKANGYIKIGFDFDADSRKDGSWNVSVYTGNDKTPCYEQTDISQAGIETPKIPVKKGTVVYVKVTPNNEYYPPLDVAYQVRFRAVSNSMWEREDNDTKSKATKMIDDELYYGNIQWDGNGTFIWPEYTDVDYWKYTADSDGKFQFRLKPASIDTELEQISEGWKVELYLGSSASPVYQAVVKDKTLKSPDFAVKKGTTVYLKIQAQNTINAPKYVDYALKIDAAKSKYWENEKNNSTSSARKMTLGKAYYGNIANITVGDTVMDKDYFKVTAKKTGKMKIYFGKKNASDAAGQGWNIVVKNKNKTLKKVNGITKKYNANKSVCTVSVKKGEVIYIRISGPENRYVKQPEYVNYILKVK